MLITNVIISLHVELFFFLSREIWCNCDFFLLFFIDSTLLLQTLCSTEKKNHIPLYVKINVEGVKFTLVCKVILIIINVHVSF